MKDVNELAEKEAIEFVERGPGVSLARPCPSKRKHAWDSTDVAICAGFKAGFTSGHAAGYDAGLLDGAEQAIKACTASIEARIKESQNGKDY